MEEVLINDPMRMLETQEVAAILKMSQKTVQKYCRDGKFPFAIPVAGRWLIRRKDLDDWIDAQARGR